MAANSVRQNANNSTNGTTTANGARTAQVMKSKVNQKPTPYFFLIFVYEFLILISSK